MHGTKLTLITIGSCMIVLEYVAALQ